MQLNQLIGEGGGFAPPQHLQRYIGGAKLEGEAPPFPNLILYRRHCTVVSYLRPFGL